MVDNGGKLRFDNGIEIGGRGEFGNVFLRVNHIQTIDILPAVIPQGGKRQTGIPGIDSMSAARRGGSYAASSRRCPAW